MQPRQLSYLAEFMADIGHIQGTVNFVTDALSQLLLSAFTAAATASSTSLQLHHMDMEGQVRPIIPVPDRKDVFRAIHKRAQAGTCATGLLMTA
jgi:hypothetical protein